MLRPPMEPEDTPTSESAEASNAADTIPAGRPEKRRPLGAAAGALVLGAIVFVLMSREGHLPHGALWGGLSLFGAVLFGLRALGMLQPAAEDTPSLATLFGLDPEPSEPRWLAPKVALIAAVAVLAGALVLFGGHGLPWGIALALACLLPAALRRPAWLALVVPSIVLLPLLGTYGLWDPWETHYGEVSREILSRDDWLSLWWAQDKWFWSKPIYIFWSEALTWSASGVGFLPDSHFQHSEWVLRLPIFCVSLGALFAVYVAISRAFGKRAGCLAAIVLSTTPYFGFLSHQSITDMPFVGLMTVAVMLLAIALQEEESAVAPHYRVLGVSVSAREVVLGVFWMLALPQALYLASRNITFQGGVFAWHRDEFMFGSGHNPAVPGNFGIRDERPWANGLLAQPLSQAIVWGIGILLVTLMLRREHKKQPLAMFAFYIACALAFMAKGIPGFALPGLVAFFYLLTCRRFPMLFAGNLRVAAGALTLLTVGMPWFVAMFIRHGTAFTDRILIHDHINRLTKGVHGDNGSVQYFIEQLGYGMFPWIALLPAALATFVSLRGTEDGDPESHTARIQRELITLLSVWFIAAFTLFSAMTTKFHHYIFPAVPAASILTGLVLDRMLGGARFSGRAGLPAAVLAVLAPLPLVLGVGGLFGDLRGVLPADLSMAQRAVWALQNPAPVAVSCAFIAAGLIALLMAQRGAQRISESNGSAIAARDVAPAALIAGGVLCAFVGRDLSWVTAERPAGYERLIHLFVYNYDRPWPVHFDYRAILTGFAVVASLLIMGAAIRAVRPVLTLSIVGVAALFSLWCLDVYMIDLSPHWGQRELIDRYYAQRKGPHEPIVAWQMNWKGENFYTGNRVPVFASLNNKELEEWLKRNTGTRAYFLLEHKRLDRFKRVLGTKRKVEVLSTERDCNKFVLVRSLL
jgi:4-amino-4-deoxy-L-arabinose transferase-like glycosyltransferase